MGSRSANEKEKWDGFRPTGYHADVAKLPLAEKGLTNGHPGEKPTTVGEVYHDLANRRLDVKFEWDEECKFEVPTAVVVKWDGGERRFGGCYFNLQVFLHFLRLRQQLGLVYDNADGMPLDPLRDAVLYWYGGYSDGDSGSQDFFIVFNNGIVRERLQIHGYPEHAINVLAFRPLDVSDLQEVEDFERVEARFWYRKFYTETVTGQEMVNRRKKFQQLHGYESGWDSLSVLRQVRTLLWILIAIGGLILIQLWR